MNKPRPNADIIHAYAEGFTVEFFCCAQWLTYEAEYEPPILGDEIYEWRVKEDADS